MGKKLVFGSDKGGVGKTTTATNVAAMAVSKGKSVIYLKTDKNDDAMDWRERRIDNGLQDIPVHAAYGNVSAEIERLSKLCDILIVDCAGHDSTEFRSALTVADMLITLTKPSSTFETNTLTTVTEKVRKAQLAGNKDLQSWVLMTRVKPQKVSAAIELEKTLKSDSVWIQPLKTRLSELDVYESACNEGAGVHDLERGPSLSKAKALLELMAKEINLL